MLFIGFWRRILGTAQLAILSQFEYRLNFFTDAIVQPLITAAIELLLWLAIFKSSGLTQINGFTADYYLSYALWAAFFARITISWMYDYVMIEEINSGRINAILTRPISFYEFYFGQFMGYKLVCAGFSLVVPLVAMLFVDSPTQVARFPLALLLAVYYLILIFTIGYGIAAMAFFYNRIHSLPSAKNIILWVLTGELFPLDLLPEFWRNLLISLPFSAGVYLPVGYLTGRFDVSYIYRGFLSITLGLVVFGFLSQSLWLWGRRVYSGTGA